MLSYSILHFKVRHFRPSTSPLIKAPTRILSKAPTAAFLIALLLCGLLVAPPAFAAKSVRLKLKQSGHESLLFRARVPRRLMKASRSSIIELHQSCTGQNYRIARIPLFKSKLQLEVARNNRTDCTYQVVLPSANPRISRSRLTSREIWVLPILTRDAPIPAPTPVARRFRSNCPATLSERVIAQTNRHRRNRGLPELHYDALLEQLALSHSTNMVASQQLSHDGWLSEAMSFGLLTGYLAQNIASTVESPSALVDMWMASPGHSSNILDRRAIKIGIGCLRDSNGKIWWTQQFSS